MNDEEKYRAWKERPRPTGVSGDFSPDVMRRIYRESGERQTQRNWPRVLELFQRNVALQYAAMVVAAVAGLSPLWLIFYAILQP